MTKDNYKKTESDFKSPISLTKLLKSITLAYPRVQKNRFFKTQTTGLFGFYWVWGFIGFSEFLFERAAENLLVDLAHQLSFYLDLPVL